MWSQHLPATFPGPHTFRIAGRYLAINVGLLSILASGCNRPPAASSALAAGEAQAAQTLSVTLVKPERKTVHRTVEQPGTIEAFQQTPVYAKISGYVQKVHKDIGDRVRTGDLLAELWVPEMVEELKRKEALVKQADAEVEQAKKALAAAEAHLKSIEAQVREAIAGRARAQAEYAYSDSQYKRYEGATEKDTIERSVLDEVRFRRDAAKAAIDEVEAKINSARAAQVESEAKRDKAQADVSAALAHLEVTKADRDQMKALLGYATVPAPFDGVVTRRTVDTGHFVQPAAGSGSKGEPLFVVAQMDPVRIFVDVPESDAGLVRDGAPARVRVQALQWQDFDGKVTRTAWSLAPIARTLRTEIDLPNPEGKLRPNMYVYATIPVEKRNVWVLPAAAVMTQGEQSFCYRVEQGKAVRMPLKVGIRDGQSVEVLKKQTGKESAWQDFTGGEIIAGSAAGLTEGQTAQVSGNP